MEYRYGKNGEYVCYSGGKFENLNLTYKGEPTLINPFSRKRKSMEQTDGVIESTTSEEVTSRSLENVSLEPEVITSVITPEKVLENVLLEPEVITEVITFLL